MRIPCYILLSWSAISFNALAQTTATSTADPAVTSGASTANTSNVAPPFEVQNGRIVIPGWDDGRSSASIELLRIGIDAFPGAREFRGRLLVGKDPIISQPFTLPAEAGRIAVTARSLQTEYVFPRIRLTLSAKNHDYVLFDDYWASLSMERKMFPLPEHVSPGNEARLKIEFLNTGTGDDYRTLYFGFISFYPAAHPADKPD